MFESFDGISLNSDNTDTSNKNKKNQKSQQLLLNESNKDNNNNILLNQNKSKKQLSKKKEISITINEIVPKKEEDKIICFSRRRKFPKNISDLSGYLVTFFFFFIFTIVFTLCLVSAKNLPTITDSIKNIYNLIIVFTWLTSIISMMSLTDAATADPGRQRGTPISKDKYDKGKIKKFVGGQKYTLKYCQTCHLVRDVRTFHCNICGLCIEKHDHHCNYLSNCVGIYNYKKFFLFLVISSIHVSIIFFTCCDFIIFRQSKDNIGYEWISFLIIFIIIFAGFFEIFTIWMIIQHIVTIVENRTTREFIKKKEYGIYNKGCKENCKEALCSNSIKEL